MQTIQIAVDLSVDELFENNEMFQGILNLLTTESVSLSPGTAKATIIEDESMYMYTRTLYMQYYINILTHSGHSGDCWFHRLTILCQGG